jgi:succinoglycan biosynthesis protein ExoA
MIASFTSPEGSACARVLVVVPTLDEAPHIEHVLEGLLRDAEGLDMRLVVVDGGSRDGTIEIVRQLSRNEPRLLLLRNPARIQSAGINLAVRRYGLDADVLIRCDAHARYPQRFCQRLLQSLEEHQADAVVVPLDSQGETRLQRAIAWLSDSPLGNGGAAHRAGCRSGFVDHGHHAAFRMRSFRAAGGYDPSFSHNEDAELDCRQRALGARIFLDCEIRVGYTPRKTLGALYRQYFKYGQGRSRTVRRHPRSLRLRQLVVPAQLLVTLLCVLISPWFPLSLLWPALYGLGLLLVCAKLALAHRSWWALLGVPAAATMHTAWAIGFVVGLFSHRERLWQRHMAVPLALRPVTGDVS